MANLPALTPTNFAEAMTFAEALAKSTMVPPAFQRNPANILVAIQWGAEVGLGPMQALQNIAVINGKPAVYGDAMLALVRGSPVCEDVIERIERDGDDRIAICEARRKGKEPVIRKFSINDAKRAGLWGKSGPWSQYPGRMLAMRARGFALRDAFPDVLRGVISAEEAADSPREMKDITPVADVTAELDAFGLAPISDPVEPPPEDPREAGEEHPAPPEGDLLVAMPRKGRGWDWPAYATALIARARVLDPMHMGDFRVTNAQQMNNLRVGHKDEWSRVMHALATLERGDDIEDEQKDDV